MKKTLLTMAFAAMALPFCFSSSDGRQELTIDEMAQIQAGKMSIECDECECNMNTGICTCRGCKIIISPD